MAVWRFVNIKGEKTELLADLSGIENDLKATIEICDRLKDALLARPPDLILLEALSSAALVRYARCFVSGVRAKVPDSLFKGLTPEMKNDHQWFKSLRDKYVAHSVNPFEKNEVHAYLYPEERGERKVSSISVQQDRLASLGLDDICRLKALCNHFIERVEILIEDEKKKVLDYARSLPVDELYEREARAPKGPTREDVDKRRKRS